MNLDYKMDLIEYGEITIKALHEKRSGSRLMQIHANRIPDGYEIFYNYANGYDMRVYKVVIQERTEIPSISDIFPTASFLENEMAELFGIRIHNIALNYHHSLYSVSEKTPFKD